MSNIPCPHCGRQISDQSQRCLYCARPLTEEPSSDADKRARMLAAMYAAGVGLPTAPKASRLERLHDEPLPVKLLVSALLIPIGLFLPFRTWKWIRTIFRP